MNEITIKEKLTLMREGYSLESINEYINESAKDTGTIFLESLYGDIGNIRYLMEADVPDDTPDDKTETKQEEKSESKSSSAKARMAKMIQWIRDKLAHFLQFLKEKLKGLKEMIIEFKNRVKTKIGKASSGEFFMYDKVFDGTSKISEVFTKSANMASADNVEKYSGKSANQIHELILEEVMGETHMDFGDFTAHILGKKKLYKINGETDAGKLIRFLEESETYEGQLIKMGETMAEKIHSVDFDDAKFMDSVNYYTGVFMIMTSITSVIRINIKMVAEALHKITGAGQDKTEPDVDDKKSKDDPNAK
jgi:DNA-binding transcriptional MerR regulator